MTSRSAPARRRFTCAAIAVPAVMMFLHSVPVAHHSFAAEFDVNKPVELKGTIVKMEWVNPHSWLHVEVKTPDGKTETWAVEFGAPNTLYRRGWRRDMLPVGQSVTVQGWAAKNGSRTANASDVVLPSGQKLFAGSSGTGAPYEGRK